MGLSDFNILGNDKRKRTYILPKKVVWQGTGVANGEYLVNARVPQIYPRVPENATLSTQNGEKGSLLLDFGSELAGSLEILVSRGISDKENGVTMLVRFGESVSEAMTPLGNKHACNNHSTRDMTVLLTANSQQTFGDTGYRFVYLELLDEDAYVDLAGVRAVLTYRDIPYLGSFSCDDPLLEQIYNVSAYTVHLNMQNMLWDGIKRDRLVWIGDVHPEMLAIRTVFGANEIIDDGLRFVSDAYPLPNWPNRFTTYGFWYLKILWDWYYYTDNKKLVIELKDYWRGLLEQIFKLIHENKNELLKEEEFTAGFFVDWPTRDTEEAKAGVYALLRLALLSAANLCGLVEDIIAQKQCLRYTELLREYSLMHNDRKQIVALLDLADMTDNETCKQVLPRHGGHGMSTFMSYYILVATARTVGMECAQDMLKEYYGGMLAAGATTFWEDFDLDWVQEGATIDRVLLPGEYDIHGDNGRFCYQGMRHSLCHGWSAGPTAFLAEFVLGIQILEAGCKKIAIKPNLGHLTWAKGTYPTPYGIITVDIHREDNKIIINVDAPKEITIV